MTDPSSTAPAPFVLHIGMPKTATTTLQAEVYPAIAERTGRAYPGLLQPEGKISQPPLIQHLHRWFSHGQDEADLKRELEAALASGPLVMSHESILSSTIDADWRLRLERVGALMRPYAPQVYVTVRNPLEAMHSYYVEHYLDAPSGRQTGFEEAFASDPRLQIYRYATSMPLIEQAFGTRPVVETMGAVVAGDSVFLRSMMGGAYLGDEADRHNVKTRKGGDTHFDRVTLRDRARGLIYRTPLGNSAAFRSLVRRIGPRLAFLDRVQAGKVVVPGLTDDQRERLGALVRGDIDYMREMYGVDLSPRTSKAAPV